MPVYCYRTLVTDELIEIHMSYEEMKLQEDENQIVVFGDGIEARRDYSAEHGGFIHRPGLWSDFWCDAAGINPNDVDEHRAADKALSEKYGNHAICEYNDEGQAKFTGREHRKVFLESHGMFDRDAGFGDATPGQDHSHDPVEKTITAGEKQ